MSTLHLCHWPGKSTFKQQLHLLNNNDSLIIYGNFTQDDELWLHCKLKNHVCSWYLVKQQVSPNPSDHEINYEQWLLLIIEHKNTLAWK